MRDPDCPDCPEAPALMNDGKCYWVGCELMATDVLYTDGIKRKIPKVLGAPLADDDPEEFVPTGDIELCAGHMYRHERLGRLDLKWTVIEAALMRRQTLEI